MTGFFHTAQAQTPDFRGTLESLRSNSAGLSDSARLHRLFEAWWEYGMYEYPEWASYEGFPGQDDRWTDVSMEASDRRQRELQWPLAVLNALNRNRLNAADRVNYDLFRKDIENQIEDYKYPGIYLRISQLGGIQQEVPGLMEITPRRTVKDYEDRLARLRGVPRLVDQNLVLLQQGIERGIVPPRITVQAVPEQVLSVIPDDPMKSAMLEPFTEISPSIAEADRKRLTAEAVEIYRRDLVPAFRKLHKFVVEKYLPASRSTIGLGALPGGAEWYANNVRRTTTTNLTPKEIYDIGVSEVKRIRGEMDKLIASTGFKGDFAAFTKYIRTDPKFFYTDAESLLAGYRDICKRADPELIKLFGTLPRLPYGVVPVPSYSEKSQTTAYYMSGALESGRPGYFYANTYNLKSRPKWEMEALALHEAVPGHHLQISIARELENMPQFRKSGGYTAYVEGWGLYSESLGEEMGFYKDPYSKFGQLTYEMWRAIRLVLDPGIHSMGWTREQAIKFFTENSGKTEHDIAVEVDRYIAWPGQATAYKIGELKLKELRRWATEQLGARFDVRAFHDQVLGNGAIPLDLLEQQIHAWVQTQKAKAGQ